MKEVPIRDLSRHVSSLPISQSESRAMHMHKDQNELHQFRNGHKEEPVLNSDLKEKI